MSSEASRTGYGSDAVSYPRSGSTEPGRAGWPAIERRVLLSKLQALEDRARRLDYLETRLRDLNCEVQRLSRLADATHTFHAADDTNQLLEAALGKCAELLSARAASVCLRDGEELVVAKACGPLHASVEGTRSPVGQGVAGYVAARCEPVHVADVERDGRFPPRGGGRYATGSFISAPVLNGDGALGVLNVADRNDGQPFTEGDLRTALRLAQDLATALERTRRLEATQDRHQQFVSKLTHELRNPLDGVLRFINLTLADAHPEERRRRYLMASKQGIERLTGIVNSLSNSCRYARASDEPALVGELLHQAVQLQEGKAERRGIGVRLEIEPDLPPVHGGGSLFQVFTNLISNAYDAMGDRGGMLTVGCCRDNGAVVVRIADTGEGMPPDVLERIFTPFFSTKEPGKGMGLGLAVCREIIGRLRGEINVSSEPGSGTEFTISVPYATTQGAARP